MKNRSIILSILVLGALFVAGLWQYGKSAPQKPVETYSPSAIPENWVKLIEPSLGLTIAVPRTIIAYSDLTNPSGCELPLILGVPQYQSVSLMPEFSDCEKTLPLREFGGSENYYSKKFTVVPVTDISEIKGAIKSFVTNNSLVQQCGVGPAVDLNSIEVSVPELVSENPGATVPVRINSRCNISPYALSVQYSPHYKKIVVVESVFGYGESGDYYKVKDEPSDINRTVDLEVYRSIELQF